MAQDISTITRRSMVAALALSASPITLAGADNAYAQAQTTPEKVTTSGWAESSP